MSVTFSSEAAEHHREDIEDPCSCAQEAECFGPIILGRRSLDHEARQELASFARPRCCCCKGTGIWRRSVTTLPELNLANGNACCVLSALGLPPEPSGQASVANFRRALIRARNTDVSRFTREERIVHGAPRENEDGSIELRPVRMHSFGLNESGLSRRLGELADVVEAHAAAGATDIFWA